MREQMESRLTELRRDFQLGQGQLQELSRQEAALRETLLRISGAIQLLEELLGHSQPSPDGEPAAPETLHVP
jgi:prefoldin subunit 5